MDRLPRGEVRGHERVAVAGRVTRLEQVIQRRLERHARVHDRCRLRAVDPENKEKKKKEQKDERGEREKVR